uniref:Uncharacterized protein n=1 Tax=Anguilla anguilla TaxID=7936 RepID=A0A0E9QTI3_ANGAN
MPAVRPSKSGMFSLNVLLSICSRTGVPLPHQRARWGHVYASEWNSDP